MLNEMELLKKQIKENIQLYISNNELDNAMSLIEEYLKIDLSDVEIYSMKSVGLIMQGKMNEAESVLKQGLSIDNLSFDLNYNLGYLYEQMNRFNEAVKYYKTSLENCEDQNIKTDIIMSIEKISSEHDIRHLEDKSKIAFFVKEGMDSFLGDIIEGVSDEYEIRKIIVNDINQIQEGMQWADICWFEWCDELVAYGSTHSLSKSKKIICRLHSYEAFTEYPSNVNWENVDKVIFVGKNIRDFVIDVYKLDESKAVVIPNGVDINKYNFREREPGFNIAYVGYLNYKKGPMLLLHTFKAMYDKDNRYKLHIAGKFQDHRDILYFNQMIEEFGIKDNVYYDGWQDNLDEWLEDKNYILCTSVLESQNMSVMQAMCKGIKPIIHNFVGAKTIYDSKYVWNTIDEAIDILKDNTYNSKEYFEFIQNTYSLNKQTGIIKNIFKNLNISKKSTTVMNKFSEEFLLNPDNIENTEKFFDYLLDNSMEQEYMKYLSEWFIRSEYDLTSRFNFYYGNMYRKFSGYSRFKYIDKNAYYEMESIGKVLCEKYYSIYFRNKDVNYTGGKKKNLFILNGLDINQSVTQFFINYLSEANNTEFEYSVLSLLNENEFSNSNESIEHFKKLNINIFLPKSNNIEDKIKEFYSYISINKFDYVIYQSLYYAPIGVLLYPLLEKVCNVIGKIQFQQPEEYFDKKLDFVYTYIKKDNLCKKIFELMSPINTRLVDKSLNIRDLLNIDHNKKIIVSIGRLIKYKNKEFWNFVIKLLKEVEDSCFVVFGCEHSDLIEYIPDKLIKEKKIFFGGFNLGASAYLKSCDYYLNSYPGGGYTLEEAYYAELPIISFYEEEKNGEKFDAMTASYMAIAYLYNDAINIFPKTGDFDRLLEYSKKLIEDNNFREFIYKHRKIKSSNLSFRYFINELEKYICSIENEKMEEIIND
jgi:Glycosyltransferase